MSKSTATELRDFRFTGERRSRFKNKASGWGDQPGLGSTRLRLFILGKSDGGVRPGYLKASGLNLRVWQNGFSPWDVSSEKRPGFQECACAHAWRRRGTRARRLFL